MRDTQLRHVWEYINQQAERYASSRRIAIDEGPSSVALTSTMLEQEVMSIVRLMRNAMTSDPTAVAVTLDRDARTYRVHRAAAYDGTSPFEYAQDYGMVVIALEGIGSNTRALTQEALDQDRARYYLTRGEEIPE